MHAIHKAQQRVIALHLPNGTVIGHLPIKSKLVQLVQGDSVAEIDLRWRIGTLGISHFRPLRNLASGGEFLLLSWAADAAPGPLTLYYVPSARLAEFFSSHSSYCSLYRRLSSFVTRTFHGIGSGVVVGYIGHLRFWHDFF
jgi:hypothetical protein